MNFCTPIFEHAQKASDQIALVIPRMQGRQLLEEETCSYGELMERVACYQYGLAQAGYQHGDRVIILLRPCVDLYALTLALLAAGMVPVFIDSGMPKKVIRAAIRAANARALVSHKQLMRWAFLLPEARGLERLALEGCGITYGALAKWKPSDDPQKQPSERKPQLADCNEDDKGLITFTSGSTGTPKGANRTQLSLINQHLAIREHWPDSKGDIDMPCFPVLVLHNLCCGMTTVMPRVDLAAPGNVHGDQVVDQIRRHGVTRLSGAPAFLYQVAGAAAQRSDCIASLNEVVLGGATVSPALQRKLKRAFPTQQVRIVYGSTEAEPIADITLDRAMNEDDERGYLVGDVAHCCEIAIVDDNQPLNHEDDVQNALLANGQCGEILVRGEHVLKGYVDNPDADRENKIPCANGLVWHRTGDTGFFTETGALCLVGRIKDRFELAGKRYDVLPLEKALEQLNGVQRVALLPNEAENTFDLCLEMTDTGNPALAEQLDQWRQHYNGAGLNLYKVNALPVDRRHNSKLDRVTLRDQIEQGKLTPWRTMQPLNTSTIK